MAKKTAKKKRPAKKKLELTEDNYFSLPADNGYLSSHQYQNFVSCPAKEIARLKGEYVDGEKRCYVIGRYIDTALTTPGKYRRYVQRDRKLLYKKPAVAACKTWTEKREIAWDFKNNPIEDFFKQNPEVYLSQDKLADITLADKMILSARKDPVFMDILSGQTQMILTGELDGMPMKGIPDSINAPLERFTDLKSSRDFGTLYVPELGKRVPWYEAWKYWTQMSIYQELILQNYGVKLTPVIAGISKKDPPGRQIVVFEDQDRLDRELEKVMDLIPSIKLWKSGKVEPPMCGRFDECDWCRVHGETEILTAESHR